jgi:CO/xanthine dehydrogenase FAD-binding subunit
MEVITLKTNTKILASEFKYFECRSLSEILALLDKYKESARILAGGTDLLVQMKLGSVQIDNLIFINNLKTLNYIETSCNCFKIGSVTGLREIEKNEQIKLYYSALYEAVRSMSAVSVKNMATIGGNLCNASPAADTAPPLLVYNASLKLVSKRGERLIPIEDFFLGPRKTALASDELLAEILIPKPGVYAGSGFLKLGRVSADIAKISVAVFLEREGRTCVNCRIAFGSVAPTPIRVPEAENVLVGKIMTTNLMTQASKTAADFIKPITDIRSTSGYRQQVSKIILEEVIRAAWKRTGGEGNG